MFDNNANVYFFLKRKLGHFVKDYFLLRINPKFVIVVGACI